MTPTPNSVHPEMALFPVRLRRTVSGVLRGLEWLSEFRSVTKKAASGIWPSADLNKALRQVAASNPVFTHLRYDEGVTDSRISMRPPPPARVGRSAYDQIPLAATSSNGTDFCKPLYTAATYKRTSRRKPRVFCASLLSKNITLFWIEHL